jgi:hypothetical protein
MDVKRLDPIYVQDRRYIRVLHNDEKTLIILPRNMKVLPHQPRMAYNLEGIDLLGKMLAINCFILNGTIIDCSSTIHRDRYDLITFREI